MIGFTLRELLVVISIIGVLIALLIGSLQGARRQAQTVKCQTNQRALGQGVHLYSADHQGFGQLMAFMDAWQALGYRPQRYVYEQADLRFTPKLRNSMVVTAPWMIAYSSYIGSAGLKSQEIFAASVGGLEDIRARAGEKKRLRILTCPSDTGLIGAIGWPYRAAGALSYSINHDLFGTTADRTHIPPARVWKNGKMNADDPLEGQLERVNRPGDVTFFVDGGDPSRLFGPYPRYVSSHDATGPFLADTRPTGASFLAIDRHSRKGAIVSVFVDGHCETLRPVAWDDRFGLPARYSVQARVSPYRLRETDVVPARGNVPRGR